MARKRFTCNRPGTAWVATAACAMVLMMTCARAQNIAIVSDLSGKINGPGRLSMLSQINVDTQLQLDGGSRLVVIYLASGDEYSFTGPAQVRFQVAEPRVLSGAGPQKKASLLGKSSALEIKPAKVTQAAYVMRTTRPSARIKLLSPSGTHTLDVAPEFRWQAPEPGLTYQFELMDDTGKVLYSAAARNTSFTMPPSVQLREGASYSWEISTRTPDGRRYLSSSDFGIAPPEIRAQAEALRPKTDASVSDRVAYAAWLARMELQDEARKLWKALAAERPEEPLLKAYAAE